MADLITRLKVDSTEYDAKIKRAAQGLQHYVQSAHDSGDVIGRLLGNTKKYVESLGNMATVSSTARGRLAELTAAFTDLRSVYNSLSEEEKSAKGGFGQELNKQLEILKGRINDTKNELKGIDQELGNTKQAEQGATSGIEGLTSALGINVKSLVGWGAALTAGKVALDIAKDAFFASEATVDEWGRVVDSSKSLYEGFLTALNTGDISGYLSRIDDIVSAARTAYNELDRLGTMKTIQAPKVSAQQTENERIRSMIQTGRYIAPVDGRRNAVFNGREMQNGDKLTAGQIRALEKQLQNGMQNVVKLVGNEVKQTGKAIDAVYERQAKELGISLKEFRKGTSSMEEFDKRMAGYDKYQQWREQHTTIDQKSGRETVARGNPYAEYGKWGTFRVDGDRYNQLVQLIQQRDQQAAQAYGMQSQAYRTMNRAEGFTVSKLMGNGGKGGKADIQFADDSIMAQEKLVQDLTQKWKTAGAALKDDYLEQLNEAKAKLEEMTKGPDLDKLFPDASAQNYNSGTLSRGDALMQSIRADMGRENMAVDQASLKNIMTMVMKEGLDTSEIDANGLLERISNGEDIPTDFWNGLMERLNEALSEMGKEGYDLDENGKLEQRKNPEEKSIKKQEGEIKSVTTEISKITGSVQGIFGGIQQLGIELPQGLQSVMSGIQGVTSVLVGISSLVTIIAAIQGTKTVPVIGWALANGGIVPKAAGGRFIGGNSMSGDNIFAGNAWVNSGELVLNKAEQGNLASQLEGGGMQNLQLDAIIGAESIRLVLNNNGRRTGRGEYVQSRRLR